VKKLAGIDALDI